MLALGLGYVFSWSIVGPLTEIAGRLREVATGEFSERVEVANRDELGALAAGLNRTSAELGSLYQQIQDRAQELSEALERQTATSEVLNVISRSTSELQPVLDTIVATAARLCHADWAHVMKLEADGSYHVVAASQSDEAFLRFIAQNPVSPGRGTLAGRTAVEGRTVHVPDVLEDPEYTWSEGQAKGRFRTMLGVPLLRGGAVIGVIILLRNVVKPFTEKQIELVTTFADQAVIAIENVRLFDEVQARTRELTRSVAELRALSEVSQAVNSTLELQAVLRAIAAHAVALAGADAGAFCAYDETAQVFRLQATHELDAGVVEALTRRPVRLGEGATGLAGTRRAAVQIPDIDQDAGYALYDTVRKPGYRALLAVPLLREDSLVGTLVCAARRPARSLRRPSIWCRRSPTSRCSRSRTPSCSRSSSARGASSRRRAGTSPSSSPT